jgi:acyltransferase
MDYSQKNEKYLFIDALKGIGIFFVVFGHVTHVVQFREYIWNFHMPLFFAISGFLFTPNKYNNFKEFFFSKFKSIYIPYVVFFFITFAYYLLIEKKFRGDDVGIFHQLFGLIYGVYENKYLNFNGALWFLPCLFTVELLFFFIWRIFSDKSIFILIFILPIFGYFYKTLIGFPIPLGMHTALFALPFFILGFKNKLRIVQYVSFSYSKKLIFIFILILVQLGYLGRYHATIEGYGAAYLPIAIAGILLYLTIATLIKLPLLNFFGRGSIVILGFQEPTYRVVIYLYSKLIQVPIEDLRHNTLISILITLISLAILIPIILLWNNYPKKWIQNIKPLTSPPTQS